MFNSLQEININNVSFPSELRDSNFFPQRNPFAIKYEKLRDAFFDHDSNTWRDLTLDGQYTDAKKSYQALFGNIADLKFGPSISDKYLSYSLAPQSNPSESEFTEVIFNLIAQAETDPQIAKVNQIY